MDSREDDRSAEAASQNAATAGKDAENPANEKVYKVLTKDKEVCEVPASVIGMSKLITTMLEDLNLQDDDAPIPVPNVTASVFRKVGMVLHIYQVSVAEAGGDANSSPDLRNHFVK
ncbi:Skp1 family, tetramerization domain protein [Ancylostoma caninum]|uniref:Skp1 family, tetramerization domain protein n=1 Tax=Ancylostoma caninum TaxID=29170 RepID=A0A368G2E7_ANCCA|nr:Skp1 family, tetramerization domain protein [Ancylostoma caninum]